MKLNKKLIIILSIIFSSFSLLYVGIWLVIATQVKATIIKSFAYINILHNDNIQITGFPFTPEIKISNIKINPHSLNILFPSISIKYSILNNILEILGSDFTLELENSTKIIDKTKNILFCNLKDKFKLSVKPSENLLLLLLKNKSKSKIYFSSITYEGNGLNCNDNTMLIEKNLFRIEVDELQSPDKFLTKLQYKVNAQITSNAPNTPTNINLQIQNTFINLTISDIEFKQIDVNIENIQLKLKESLLSVHGNLSIPSAINNNINDGTLTIEINNYKNFVEQLVKILYGNNSNTRYNNRIYYALQDYIYLISKKKSNDSIVISINGKLHPFKLFIEQVPYQDFISKLKSIISNTEDREIKK